jgi:hypothetical protein
VSDASVLERPRKRRRTFKLTIAQRRRIEQAISRTIRVQLFAKKGRRAAAWVFSRDSRKLAVSGPKKLDIGHDIPHRAFRRAYST